MPILMRARAMPMVRMNSPMRCFWRANTCSTAERTAERFALALGCVDKRGSHLPRVLIQDCFLRSSHGSWGLVGCGMGADRAAVAA